MDWTNTKQEAAGIDHQMELQRMIARNPRLAQAMAGATGTMSLVPGPLSPDQDRYVSNLRSEYPKTFRAGALGGNDLAEALRLYIAER